MKKFKYYITQTNEFEVTIDAEDYHAAKLIFDEMVTEDFGDAESSVLKYEVVEYVNEH